MTTITAPIREVEIVADDASPTRAVELGTAFLDEHEPDWWRNVRPESLDLWDYSYCILGQVYGDYEKGLAANNLSQEDGVRLGFNVALAAPRQRMCDLQMEWERVINERSGL